MLPALTRFYGLTPPDLDEMTWREVDEYVRQYEQFRAEEERAARGARDHH